MEDKTNSSVFNGFIDKKVKILKGDFKKSQLYLLTGICRSIDGYLNAVLEDCSLLDLIENKDAGGACSNESLEYFKTCFVTGNSLKHIWLADDEEKRA